MPESILQREEPLRVARPAAVALSFGASGCQAPGVGYWLRINSSTLGSLPVFDAMKNQEEGFRRLQALRYQESWLKLIYFVYLNHHQ